MTLARSEFNSQCIDLINRSNSVGDYDWTLLQCRGGLISEYNENLIDDTASSQHVLFLSRKLIHKISSMIQNDEYNVIYSDSYEVPVLYFNSSDKGKL